MNVINTTVQMRPIKSEVKNNNTKHMINKSKLDLFPLDLPKDKSFKSFYKALFE